MSTTTGSHDDYTVAWICALSLEKTAAVLMLDTQHPPLPKAPSDENSYTFGEIQGHNIVIVCLPLGIYGTNSAAVSVAQMKTTFPSIRYALVVGIGGGAPSFEHDIRLGDVVVSKPTADHGGVIQYDYGKALVGGRFQRTGTLNKPPAVLLNAIAELHSRYQRGEGRIDTFLSAALASSSASAEFFVRPHDQEDLLFRSDYCHADESKSCNACDSSQLVDRPSRRVIHPFIHYGTIASGNQVMKDGNKRQQLAEQGQILCFEMEAAGVIDQIPSLVIRGICDYADSHKNKKWQPYAAWVAAAYGKELLSVVEPHRRRSERKSKWHHQHNPYPAPGYSPPDLAPARNPEAHQSASGHPMYPPMSGVGSDHAGTRGTSEQSSPPLGTLRNRKAYSIRGESRGVYGPPLDWRYQVQISPGEFFVVGRVFAILWHQGTVISDFISQGKSTQGQFIRGRFGEEIFSGIRRMVVVRAMSESAWCVAITTYDGQGVAKPGVDPAKHAIVYLRGSMPTCKANEPRMIKEPLEVEPARPDEKLDEMSRLNFGKVYTVEHNVKVRPVGMISWSSMAKFRGYVSNEFRLDI
ncbi:uncharacterized protein CDV56_107028 [Aspergillus thermomutatus]|uniref:Uncharacterized protein n=1 Tax=Aspergillus thermomutatus TaxID=41047 RepID=A0A397H445_ASPTH|nr:uncharacterized protein CDV56_107028 [Aspergillus thermomutatus]RHZ55170.1 hypothetical protein CDV56_107028 [Aspergillus thermomutatus]